MKTIKQIISLLIILSLSSCSDWFDVSPKSEIKSDKLFTTEAGFRDALIGVYSMLVTKESYGCELTYGYVDVLAQYYTVSGNEHKYSKTISFEYDNIDEQEMIDGIWARAYQSIMNLNAILHFIDDRKDIFSTEENFNIIKGEALALRAFIHFDILRLFAPIPSFENSANGIPYANKYTNIAQQQQSVENVINLIMDDLAEASKFLSNVGPDNNLFEESRYHINIYAINALMARVSLYNNNNEDALKYVNELIDPVSLEPRGPFELVSSASTNDRLMSSEILWSINVLQLEQYIDPYFGEIIRENPNAPINTALTINTRNITTLFEPVNPIDDDYRYKLWFYNAPGNISLPYLYFNQVEIPLVTLSEVYYIGAECSVDNDRRLSYLNKIRAHRGLTPLSEDVDISQEIEKEYKKEFLGKGQMFYYFKRFNKSRMGALNTVSISTEQYTLPIPIDEIDYGKINN